MIDILYEKLNNSYQNLRDDTGEIFKNSLKCLGYILTSNDGYI